MTTTRSQTVLSPWLTPVRLVSIANIAGTYYNGPNNNGVGATLTIAASSLTIDSVACAVGDRVLLQTQTATYQQGIYIVKSIGSTVVLERASDQQSIEQLKAGQYVSVGAGSLRAGNFYSLVEPLPNVIGVDAFVWSADPSAGGVTFSGGASTANALVVFSDTAGNIKAADAAPVTLGQNLAVTGTGTFSGAIASTAGNITSGSSGDAGTFISFPATAANGTLIFAATNAGGAFNTTVTNAASVGQSQVVSIPDVGAATGNFLAAGAALVSGEFPVLSGTGGRVVSSGVAATNIQNKTNIKAATTADIGGGGAGPISVVVAGATAASVVVATVESSSNPVSVIACTATATGFDITFSADPGAACLVNYILFIAAQ